jgi:two-component system phosphate regulon sensor histidine kinase PhoR
LRHRFAIRLFFSYALLVVVNAVVAELLVSRLAAEEQRREIEETLAGQAALLADGVRADLEAAGDPTLDRRIEQLAAITGSRLTVTRADGRVVADSAERASTMENQLGRPEFLAAAREGRGVDERVSTTTGQRTVFVCYAVPGPRERLGFVRAALPIPTLEARRDRLRGLVFGGLLAGIAIALVVAWWVTRRFSRPIAALTAAARAAADGAPLLAPLHSSDDELGELARSLERMSGRQQERLRDLESERAKLAVVLDGLAEGVLAVDAQERLLHCNAAARRMLELPPSEGLLRPLVELVRTPELVAALRLEGGEIDVDGARSREVRHRAEERERVLLVRAARLPSGGAVAALLDVTELRRLETVRRDFVANVSHELKTPLAAMRGLVETLVDDRGMDPDRHRRFLGKLGDHVGRLADLATDLLQLARAEADVPARRILDLAEAAARAVDRFAGPAERKPLDLVAELAPARVLVDPLALEQVLDNLVDNALKYTPAGGRVAVRTRIEGGCGVLEVVDDGPGIEPEEQKRVFERFYRVDKARTRDVPGTGLGLSIVKHLVEANGGFVELESWPGRGSTFRVRFARPSAGPGEVSAVIPDEERKS